MAASVLYLSYPPDTRTPAEKKAEAERWKREAAQQEADRTEEMIGAASGFHLLTQHVVQEVEIGRDHEHDRRPGDGFVRLTLDNGQVVEVRATSFDYDGEDAMPVILVKPEDVGM